MRISDWSSDVCSSDLARPDIIGDVGYSDYRLISAGVVAALIGGGPDGIVEIARVHWINGHNRQVTQVFPFIWMQRQRSDPGRLLLHLFGKGERNSGIVNGDQTETSGGEGVTQAIRDSHGENRKPPGRP